MMQRSKSDTRLFIEAKRAPQSAYRAKPPVKGHHRRPIVAVVVCVVEVVKVGAASGLDTASSGEERSAA